VVDNASTDDPESATASWRGPLEFKRLSSNRGFGAACNVGVALASARAVVMLNPDTRLLPGGLAHLAETAERIGGLVGPRVLNHDGSVQPSASGPEVGIWPWIRALWPAGVAPTAIVRRTEPYRLNAPTPVVWLTGSCVAGPREVLLRLGPFDPSFHLYGEDLDLGLRARAAGIPCWFRPDAGRIVHVAAGSSTVAYGSPHGWHGDGAQNVRAALERAYGPRRAWLGWRALRLNLALRYAAKRALGRADERSKIALVATRQAKSAPPLSPHSVEPLQDRD
jgi:N-acetylglucosaminyl-diphospho-decaprenol L-rhamnosyltransferase